jgi:hypothetical protein
VIQLKTQQTKLLTSSLHQTFTAVNFAVKQG